MQLTAYLVNCVYVALSDSGNAVLLMQLTAVALQIPAGALFTGQVFRSDKNSNLVHRVCPPSSLGRGMAGGQPSIEKTIYILCHLPL